MLFFTLFFFFTLSLCSIALRLFLLYSNGVPTQKTQHETQTRSQTDPSIFTLSSTQTIDETHQPLQCNPARLSRPLHLEILPSNSSKWETLFQDTGCCTDPVSDGSVMDLDKNAASDLGVQKSVNKKKKNKRAKKKRSSSPNSIAEDDMVEEKFGVKDELGLKEKQELVFTFPFTSSSSPTQRKIKQQFDQLVKCHESKKMTLSQIGQFANCLIEARHELQHKSEVIQRKFTITKALLCKADRSSFDRLSQQIYKLQMEQKRLEEDAFVYNLLQQQLKLSPAYKKMLEVSACLEELKAKSGEMMESIDPEFSDISFEEFLAQEKKDSFWQRNGKSKSYSS